MLSPNYHCYCLGTHSLSPVSCQKSRHAKDGLSFSSLPTTCGLIWASRLSDTPFWTCHWDWILASCCSWWDTHHVNGFSECCSLMFGSWSDNHSSRQWCSKSRVASHDYVSLRLDPSELLFAMRHSSRQRLLGVLFVEVWFLISSVTDLTIRHVNDAQNDLRILKFSSCMSCCSLMRHSSRQWLLECCSLVIMLSTSMIFECCSLMITFHREWHSTLTI